MSKNDREMHTKKNIVMFKILFFEYFFSAHMVQVDAAFKTDLDRQIASVMDCNPLLEDEVIRLCEKVGFGFEFQQFRIAAAHKAH